MRKTAMTGVALAAIMLATGAQAAKPKAPSAPAGHPAAEAQALDLAKKAFSLRSVRGPGNKTSEVAALYRDVLVVGGFAPADVVVAPVEDTAYLIARWPGSDPKLKPLVFSGFLVVVVVLSSVWLR